MQDVTHIERDAGADPGAEPRVARYSAFISYSRQDRKWAAWLHRQLETYRVPKRLRGRATPDGPLQRRLLPVFQDRAELASGTDLGASLRAALADAASLIVICSPHSAKSRWVNEEVKTFVALGKAANIQCLIVGGSPHASRRGEAHRGEECFPPALLETHSSPLAADARAGGDGKQEAKLKLLAGLLGVGYDELRQREAARRQRALVFISGASLAGVVVTSGLAIAAVLARNEAVRERQTADRTVEFVKSLFEVSDPSEAKGATITAREVLDRGARRIEAGLADEPSVKTDLSVTLGEVYMSLGLFREGEALIRKTFSLQNVDNSASLRRLVALAEAQSKQGDYETAARSYETALGLARRAGGENMAPRILVGLAEAKSSNGDAAAADRSIREALSQDVARLGPDHPDVARDLEAQALNAFFDSRLDDAKPPLLRALDIRMRAQGPRHPKVSEDLNLLGSIAYLQRDPATAERYYRQVLSIDEAVLGPDHPDLATTLNNLARVLLERRSFREADRMLQRSLAITLRERDETHDDLAFTFANLGIVRRETGQAADAEVLFRKALLAARKHRHRNLAPVMTDLADVLCTRKAFAEAHRLLAEARPLMAKTYPDDPWRVAWVDNVRAGCLWRQGEMRQAADLFRSSEPVLAERWPANSLYGHAYRARGRLLKVAAITP